MEEQPYVDSAQTITHISLCAGYGGIDIGLKRVIANLRTIAFSEIEGFACANLVAKMEAGVLDEAPIWTNLKTFPWEQFCGKVDLLSGGFPCQPWSHAGKRAGDEDPRHLFPFILAGIRIARPALVFLENVEGIITAKLAGTRWGDPAGTPVLLHVLRELERAGYRCTWGVFSAAEVGAPHQRKRVFILAAANSVFAEPNSGNLAYARLLRQEIGQLSAARLVESGAGRPTLQTRTPGALGAAGTGGTSLWPARPGEQQYAWEAPRLVHTNRRRLERPEKGRRHGKDALRPSGKGHEGQTKPPVGGELDGLAAWLDATVSIDSRVDELRLLGNGVVPATAAKGFLTLLSQLLGNLV